MTFLRGTSSSDLRQGLLALVLAGPGAALAQDAPVPVDENFVPLADWMASGALEGGRSAVRLMEEADVYEPDGEEIGSVENILFGPEGNLLAVVADLGLWDIGLTDVSIPWEAVELRGEALIVPIDEDNLEEYTVFEDTIVTARRAAEEPVSALDDNPLGPLVWQASDLMGLEARLWIGEGYETFGTIGDLVLTEDGIAAVVVSGGEDDTARALPFYGFDVVWGWSAEDEYYDLPYGVEEVMALPGWR